MHVVKCLVLSVYSLVTLKITRLITSLNSCALTLFVEFSDDAVQVGVLERNMTASHRHFAAERKRFSDT